MVERVEDGHHKRGQRQGGPQEGQLASWQRTACHEKTQGGDEEAEEMQELVGRRVVKVAREGEVLQEGAPIYEEDAPPVVSIEVIHFFILL